MQGMQAKIEEALEYVGKGELAAAQEILELLCTTGGGTQGAALHGGVETRPAAVPEGSRIVEGVFDGEHMVGADGKKYLVPPNYSSKSKLVEGDIMKLSITPQGAFIYKQIGPIERKRVVGKLEQDEHDFWHVTDGTHTWRLLTASVSYFKGKAGDEAVALVPGAAPSKWAAVENIISR